MSDRFKIELEKVEKYGPAAWPKATVKITLTEEQSRWWEKLFDERKTSEKSEAVTFVKVDSVWFEKASGRTMQGFLDQVYPGIRPVIMLDFLNSAEMKFLFKRLDDELKKVS